MRRLPGRECGGQICESVDAFGRRKSYSPLQSIIDICLLILLFTFQLNLATHYGAIKAGSDYPFGLDFHVEVSSAEYVQSSLVKTTSIATWMALDNKPLQYESGKSLAHFAAKAVYSVAVVEV